MLLNRTGAEPIADEVRSYARTAMPGCSGWKRNPEPTLQLEALMTKKVSSRMVFMATLLSFRIGQPPV